MQCILCLQRKNEVEASVPCYGIKAEKWAGLPPVRSTGSHTGVTGLPSLAQPTAGRTLLAIENKYASWLYLSLK